MAAQRSGAQLLDSINHPSPTAPKQNMLSDEWIDARKPDCDPSPAVPKREVVPVERKNVTKIGREPTRGKRNWNWNWSWRQKKGKNDRSIFESLMFFFCDFSQCLRTTTTK
jgi:hypothetical protein